MAKYLGAFDAHRTLNARAGEVRRYYEHILLEDFIIEERRDVTAAVTELTVRGIGRQYRNRFERSAVFRLVYYDANGQPALHGDPEGSWHIIRWNPWQDGDECTAASQT